MSRVTAINLVNVKQPGMSSDRRTVHDKMIESISIADYIVNDSSITNAIINALSSNVGTIIIPPGEFVANPSIEDVSGLFKLFSRCELRGGLQLIFLLAIHILQKRPLLVV